MLNERQEALEKGNGMEGQEYTLDFLFANKQTVVLLLTAAFGLLVGRIIRTIARIFAYVMAVIALIILALQYLGIIFVTVNFDFLTEIIQWTFLQAKSLGMAEHLFFWVPLVYGLKRKRILGIL